MLHSCWPHFFTWVKNEFRKFDKALSMFCPILLKKYKVQNNVSKKSQK